MIGKCHTCKKEHVECREILLKKYQHPKFVTRITSEEKILVCSECDIGKPVTKEYQEKYWGSFDRSRYGK